MFAFFQKVTCFGIQLIRVYHVWTRIIHDHHCVPHVSTGCYFTEFLNHYDENDYPNVYTFENRINCTYYNSYYRKVIFDIVTIKNRKTMAKNH